MAKYSSNPIIVNQPIETLFDRLSDMSSFQNKIDSLPEDVQNPIGDVKFDADSISIKTPQVGELKFKVTERIAPGKIVFSADRSPIPLTMEINMIQKAPESTEITTLIDVEIPLMLRPLIGNKMQEAANKFGELIAQMNNEKK